MTIGKRIQAARKSAGLSQKELGQKLGWSASMVGQYENDLRNPKKETIEKIASALNIPASELSSDLQAMIREGISAQLVKEEEQSRTELFAGFVTQNPWLLELVKLANITLSFSDNMIIAEWKNQKISLTYYDVAKLCTKTWDDFLTNVRDIWNLEIEDENIDV